MLAATASLFASNSVFGMLKKKDAFVYLPAKIAGAAGALPVGKYIPFDWSFGEISASDNGVRLSWDEPVPDKTKRVRLRITSVTDVREVVILEVKTAITNKKIADWDLRYAAYMQPFELEIPTDDWQAVFNEGVKLKMTNGTKPFWFFTGNNKKANSPNAFLPHLLVYDQKQNKDAWQDRLVSFDSVQAFGWMQGVVWDGLLELSQHSVKAKAVLFKQLNLFFADNYLVYANLNNVKTVDEISTVESILPFAILAHTNPTHPLLETAVSFCVNHANAEGVIADGVGNNRILKTEECYTVSYPLAVLAKTLNRPELARLATQTLLSRVSLLDKGDNIYQRGTEQGEMYFGNWSRGVAWYLLGLAKTLVHLPESEDKALLKNAFEKAVHKVIGYQQSNGLWYCFLHKPETGFETSGTAGIAAALIYGHQHGLLDKKAKIAALKAKNGLSPYLTPDGFLTGTAQVNKGGDALQQNGFRVISPYTLGFFPYFK